MAPFNSKMCVVGEYWHIPLFQGFLSLGVDIPHSKPRTLAESVYAEKLKSFENLLG